MRVKQPDLQARTSYLPTENGMLGISGGRFVDTRCWAPALRNDELLKARL